MMTGLRFQGNFSVEKQYLTKGQADKLANIPGKNTTILNDDKQLLMMTANENDATVSQYLRDNAIAYTWSLPAQRMLIMPVPSGPGFIGSFKGLQQAIG